MKIKTRFQVLPRPEQSIENSKRPGERPEVDVELAETF